MPEALEAVLTRNVMVLPGTNINEVKAFDNEVRMENIRNRGLLKTSEYAFKVLAVPGVYF